MKLPAVLVALVNAEESDTLLQAARLQKHEETGHGGEHRGAPGRPGCGDAEVLEDCTNRDFFWWKGNNKETFEAPTYHSPNYQPGEYGEDSHWKTTRVNATPFWELKCVAYVNTKEHGKTCKGWCEDHGMVCNAGMDDAHWQTEQLSTWLNGQPGGCTLQPVSSTLTHKLPPSSKAIDQSDNGCNAEWNTQICGCAEISPCCDGSMPPCDDIPECPKCNWATSHTPVGTLPAQAVQDCTHSRFHVWKSTDKFGYVEPTYVATIGGSDELWYTQQVQDQDVRYEGACVAYVEFDQGRKSCNEWCTSIGMRCVRGMDDAHWQKDSLSQWDTSATNACTLWPNGESRQVDPGQDGCDATYKSQICACKPI